MTAAATPQSGPGPLRMYAAALTLVAALQSAVLAWMIHDRINLIGTGREITLDVVPVDPRSLFRGDYVILNYPVSRLNLDMLGGEDDFERGQRVFVTLGKDDDGAWNPVSVSKTFPPAPGADEVVLRGRAGDSRPELSVKYGIESYFVPEGEGKTLEKRVGEKTLQVIVAVGPDGESAIKGLLIDGKLRYEEPLF